MERVQVPIPGGPPELPRERGDDDDGEKTCVFYAEDLLGGIFTVVT